MSSGYTSRPARARPFFTALLLVAGLVVLWAGYELFLALTIKPGVQFNYGSQIRELVADRQGNATSDVWPNLMRAIEAHSDILDEFKTDQGDTWQSLGHRYGILTDYDSALEYASYVYHREGVSWESQLQGLEVAEQWALQAIGSFDSSGISDELDRVAASGVARRPIPDSQDVEELLPNLDVGVGAQSLARGLHASMYRAAQRGDWNRYVTSMEHCMAVGRVLMIQPSLIDWMIGSTVQDLAVRQLHTDLVNRNIPPSVIPRVQEVYLRQSDAQTLPEVLESDLYFALDGAQRMYSSGGRYVHTAFEEMVVGEVSGHRIRNYQSVWKPRWAETETVIRNEYEQLIEKIRLPRAERIRQHGYTPFNFAAPWSFDTPVNMVTQGLRFIENGDISDRRAATKTGLELMLAIEEFAFEQGSYPQDLSELVPDYIQSVPVDQYANDGSLWRYRLKASHTRDETAFLLYSVGIDGQDDEGYVQPGTHPGRALEHGIFGEDTSGSDYVVSSASDNSE